MKIKEAFELFRASIDEKNATWGQDRHKINRFIELVGENTSVQEAITESNLAGFFQTLDRNLHGYYYALKKFYTFLQKDILNLSLSDQKKFPIKVPTDMNIDANSKKPKANYLPKGFNFHQLFDDDFYNHLHNKTATLTIKACIAVGLGAAYNTKDITNMKLDDIRICEDFVKIKNVYEKENVFWIILKGNLAEYIKGYYYFRIKQSSANKNDLFFLKYWDGRDLEVDGDIEDIKPSNIILLMTYILKYISFKNDIDPHLYPTHLYINTIFHQLLQTDGQALEALIYTYGWKRSFVKESFYQYIQYRDLKEFIGFQPIDYNNSDDTDRTTNLKTEENVDFFQHSSLDEESKSNEDVTIEMLTRRKRDSKMVRVLKQLYDNSCQICGEALININSIGYSEVNHIQPLSKHNGIDDYINMIVLCPNHHTLMDMGIITLNPNDLETILHVDSSNSLNLKSLAISKHSISQTCVKYHYDHIFKPMKLKLENLIRTDKTNV